MLNSNAVLLAACVLMTVEARIARRNMRTPVDPVRIGTHSETKTLSLQICFVVEPDTDRNDTDHYWLHRTDTQY
jgi:hypothetical protein